MINTKTGAYCEFVITIPLGEDGKAEAESGKTVPATEMQK